MQKNAFRIEPNVSEKQNLQKQSSHEWGIEGLRGLAALSVGISHVFGFQNALDPGYHPVANWGYFAPAHGAVLIFFVLSGYVIGLTNKKPFSSKEAIKYLIRRGLCILPIYLIAIGLALLIRPIGDWNIILGHILFLQPWFVSYLPNNPILWTLSYEILYYLIFLIIWYLRPNIFIVFIGSFILSVIGWINPNLWILQPIASYTSGWIFWLTGLCLAWKVPSQETNSQTPILIPIFSYLLLLNATNFLSPAGNILNGLGFNNSVAGMVNLSDLAFLPICLLIIASITKRYFRWLSWLKLLVFIIPLSKLLIMLKLGKLLENEQYIISSICLILSLLILWFKTSPDSLKNIYFSGQISCAFYVLHMPIMNFIHDRFLFQGTAYSFWLRFISWFALTVLISTILELVMQPAIKLWYKKIIEKPNSV